jgi:hypothetical protein
MTEIEKELLELIRNSENPQLALYKAIGIIQEVTESSYPAYLKR